MLLLGFLLLVSAAVILAIALSGPSQSTGVARSLEILDHRPSSHEVAKHELAVRDRFVEPVMGVARAVAERLSPGGTGERLAQMLDRAGNPSPWTVERVMGAKGATLLLGAVLGLLIFGLSAGAVVASLLLGVASFFLPDLLVYNAGLKRQEMLQRGLAEALDMLTVCVEAGLGFDAAILQVARNVPGPISGEFARALAEIQIGKSRAEAFAGMGERTSAPEVKNFVTALVQADRLGLPIAAVLRGQASEMRAVRRQRAEEQAQKISVKILFPLLLCIFPAIFVVVIGPGVIRLIDTFSRI